MAAESAPEGHPERLAPSGLSERACEFWARIQDEFEPSDAETELLVEVVQTITEIDSLKAALTADGVSVQGSMGQKRVHPAVNEIRQHRMALARLLKQLDLGDEEPETEATKAARRAAQARWSQSRGRDRARGIDNGPALPEESGAESLRKRLQGA